MREVWCWVCTLKFYENADPLKGNLIASEGVFNACSNDLVTIKDRHRAYSLMVDVEK